MMGSLCSSHKLLKEKQQHCVLQAAHSGNFYICNDQVYIQIFVAIMPSSCHRTVALILHSLCVFGGGRQDAPDYRQTTVTIDSNLYVNC